MEGPLTIAQPKIAFKNMQSHSYYWTKHLKNKVTGPTTTIKNKVPSLAFP
jgi:hypothetical protein